MSRATLPPSDELARRFIASVDFESFVDGWPLLRAVGAWWVEQPECDGTPEQTRHVAEQVRDSAMREATRRDADDYACSNPGGHEWNRTLGEADEARVAGDVANDNIRCVHCGADGDA